MESYQSLIQYFPYVILGFLLVAGAFLLKVLMAYSRVVYRARQTKQALAGPLSAFRQKELEAEDAATQEDSPEERGKFATFWHNLMVRLKVREENDEIIVDFKNAMGILEKHLGHKDYQYKLPWFLLLGTTESGKSHILEDIELDLPLGHPEYEHEGQRSPLKWWFFDRGIVIDVVGDYLLTKTGTDNNERGWSILMSLLLKYRTKRPIDGVILTIPADELYGDNKLSHEELVARGKHLHTKLWSLQQTLAMRIPVYIVITKTDLVPGFTEFTQELPQTSLKEMMGWATPYSLVTAFTPAWIDDAYEYIQSSLKQIRAEVFQEGAITENADGAFIFNVELEKTKEHLEAYLSNIFKESAFKESLFLRGIYFSGDVGNHTAVGDLKRSDRFWTPPEAIGAALEQPFQEHDDYNIAFTTDLFERKIFPEGTLAKPINRMMRSTSKWLNFSKVAVAAIAIVWSIGLYRDYQSFSVGKSQILTFVQEVDQTLHNMHRRDFDLSKVQDAHYLNEQTIKILKAMAEINITRSTTIFIPASWFAKYDENLEKSTAVAWNEIVLQSMYSGLQERGRKLFLPIQEKIEDENGVNPTKKFSFTSIYQFVSDTIDFERFSALYNNLESSENIEDVGKIVRYLYKVDMPASFYENSFYYKNALGRAKGADINTSDFSAAAQKKLQLLFDRFIESTFNAKKSVVDIDRLTFAMEGLINLASDREMNQTKLYANIDTILSYAKIITDPEMKWIEAKEFNPAEKYSGLLNNIANSRILGVQSANTLSKLVQSEFVLFKDALKILRAPLMDTVFSVKNATVQAQPSAAYENLVKTLANLLQQPFMAQIPVVQNVSPSAPGRLLFWDESMLARTAKLTESFDTYVAEQLPPLPEDLRLVMRSIGRFNLAKHAFHMIAKAQTFRNSPQSVTGYDEQEILQQQIQNLKISQTYFDKILGPNLTGTLSQQESRLRDVLADYAYGILSRIDQILVREDLYGLGDDKLSWWQGVDMVGLRAFGVYDLDGMKAYLVAQKDRIMLLGKDLASPILTFLNYNFLKSINRNNALKTKWTRIVVQLDASEKQIPGNSVSVLEHFLQYDLNQVGYDTCYDLIDATDPVSQTGDFFLDKRNRIRMAMVDRCKTLLHAKGVESYNKLSQFFNMYLSGRFPFTDAQSDATETEAAASDVEVFLSMYDGLGEIERQSIEDYFEFTGSKQSPAEFLRQIDLIRPLLQASLDGNMSMHLPKLDVEVTFRTDRNLEMGGDKIIDWSLALNGSNVDFWDQKRVGSWSVGQDVSVDLQWAIDGKVYPLKDPTNPNLTIAGATASFKYKGRWSLVRLVKAHATDVIKFSNKTPITLEFQIPTSVNFPDCEPTKDITVDDKAKVYLHLNLSVPGKPLTAEEKAMAEADRPKAQGIPVPLFPVSAPVITKGQVVR